MPGHNSNSIAASVTFELDFLFRFSGTKSIWISCSVTLEFDFFDSRTRGGGGGKEGRGEVANFFGQQERWEGGGMEGTNTCFHVVPVSR